MKDQTKQDVIDKMAKDAGINKTQALKALDAATSAISKALVKGQQTRIKGFGTFKTLKREDRNGRNPQTGEKLVIKAHKVIRFIPATKLAETTR